MNKFHQLIFFNFILFLQINSACSLCKMPTAWIGSWYQCGMNSLLEITNDYIQTKGFCFDGQSSQQYYLFTDQSTRCNRCLKFIQRHRNFLQYRESECHDPNDLINVTSCSNLIAPDAVLYTLHRNNSHAQICPIQPSYSIANFIKENSFCDQTKSLASINQCAKKNQFHLYLPSCSPSQSILNLHLVCVGTWIENHHTYFVTRILSKSNNQYACFKYLTQQSSSNNLILNMATDDSCRDLYSQHMSTKLTLSYQQINESQCQFPKKYQFNDWYSINRSIRMNITNNQIDFEMINKRFSCQKQIHSEQSILIYQVQTYTNCQRKFECLRLIERTSNILEISTYSPTKDHHCHSQFHQYHFYETFYIKSSSMLCPNYLGRLIFQSNIDYYLKRKFHMSIGCSKKDQLIISEKENDLEIIQMNTCLAYWQSDDRLTTYLIIQSEDSNRSSCLSFQMTNPIIIRNNSNRCLFTQSENEHAISIYSAQLMQICSNGRRISLTKVLFEFIILCFLYL